MAKSTGDPEGRDQIREAFTPEPGKGHLIEQALAERENLVAYGKDTGAVDKRLAGLGYGAAASRDQRKTAAAERRAALETHNSGPGGGHLGGYPSAPDPGDGPAGDGQGDGEGDDRGGQGDGGTVPASRKQVTEGRSGRPASTA